jgi:hypothetical protein
MTIPTDHPFRPGARVAAKIYPRLATLNSEARYTVHTVEKLRKDGRFTIAGIDGQWTPQFIPPGSQWQALQRGDERTVVFIDDEVEREMQEAADITARRRRFHGALDKINRYQRDQITDQVVDALEMAVAAMQAAKGDDNG